MTLGTRGGGIAVQNPNPTAVDVILQAQTLDQLSRQITVTIPPGALHVYSGSSFGAGNGVAQTIQTFASLPVRILGMALRCCYELLASEPHLALPPIQKFTASPAAVSFRWQSGTAAPAPMNISLSAVPTYLSSSFTCRVTPPFSVTPTQGTTPTMLTVSVNPIGLSAGTYSANIVLTPDGPNAVVATIPLSLTVSETSLLAVNPQKLTFSGPEDYSQGLKVESNGTPIAFTVAAAVAAADGAGPHWLTASISGGTTPAQLSVNARSTNLSEGVYYGQIVITGPNNSVTVPVELNVSASHIFSF